VLETLTLTRPSIEFKGLAPPGAARIAGGQHLATREHCRKLWLERGELDLSYWLLLAFGVGR
jgi:hypothetical protein